MLLFRNCEAKEGKKEKQKMLVNFPTLTRVNSRGKARHLLNKIQRAWNSQWKKPPALKIMNKMHQLYEDKGIP